jgi:hypothetical protein
VGSCRDKIRHGQGKFFSITGEKLEGLWDMDELHISGQNLDNIFVNSKLEIFRG